MLTGIFSPFTEEKYRLRNLILIVTSALQGVREVADKFRLLFGSFGLFYV